ncbi:MAG: DUF402 domain-containing protein [Acetatifactor sp.]|nr:DUF402 domain-containing protein [Acetatifactor sp.]
MAGSLKLYRKRLIPSECIPLKDDIIVMCDEELILTRWNTLRAKRDFTHGSSCYFLKEGIKVSKFYRADNSLLYWYCDIVDFEYKRNENVMIVTDLLADVIIFPDGHVKVMDLDELAEAMERKLISKEQMIKCLRRLHNLLDIIDRDKFDRLQEKLNQAGL